MKTYMQTTMMTNITDKDEKLTGNEKYDIIGNAIPELAINNIIEKCAGLNKYWNCMEKAHIARETLGFGYVVFGSLTVWSYDYRSSYGYLWNPPFEFHAWVNLGAGHILDIALPGVIEKGLNIYDDISPALVGREPLILNDIPQRWMEYTPAQVY